LVPSSLGGNDFVGTGHPLERFGIGVVIVEKAIDRGLNPGGGQLTALAFVAAIGDPSRIRRYRDTGAYLGLVPRRYQSGEVDYIGSIPKCGDKRYAVVRMIEQRIDSRFRLVRLQSNVRGRERSFAEDDV
jgi:transposase